MNPRLCISSNRAKVIFINYSVSYANYRHFTNVMRTNIMHTQTPLHRLSANIQSGLIICYTETYRN